MNRTALIVAEAAGERRAIAQFLKPTELFEQIHFCGSHAEVDFLLEHSRIDMICCDVRPREKDALNRSSALAGHAKRQAIPLIFFSCFDPIELPLLGIIPADSHCLNYDSSISTASVLLRRLLTDDNPDRQPPQHSGSDKLIDMNSGIYNRFYFDAILDQEISRSKLTGRPFSLLLIEPETSPQSLGRKALRTWNSLLPSVALTIKTQVRTSDLLCRLEKKRLALLLPETSFNNAEQVVNRLRSKIQELSDELQLKLKFGLASPAISSHVSRHGLLSQAEAAL